MAFPDKPLVIAEFGAVGIPGMHGDIAATEDFQAAYIRSAWAAISGMPEVSGGVLWSWADYYHRRPFQANGPFSGLGRGDDRPPPQGGDSGPSRRCTATNRRSEPACLDNPSPRSIAPRPTTAGHRSRPRSPCLGRPTAAGSQIGPPEPGVPDGGHDVYHSEADQCADR